MVSSSSPCLLSLETGPSTSCFRLRCWIRRSTVEKGDVTGTGPHKQSSWSWRDFEMAQLRWWQMLKLCTTKFDNDPKFSTKSQQNIRCWYISLAVLIPYLSEFCIARNGRRQQQAIRLWNGQHGQAKLLRRQLPEALKERKSCSHHSRAITSTSLQMWISFDKVAVKF